MCLPKQNSWRCRVEFQAESDCRCGSAIDWILGVKHNWALLMPTIPVDFPICLFIGQVAIKNGLFL